MPRTMNDNTDDMTAKIEDEMVHQKFCHHHLRARSCTGTAIGRQPTGALLQPSDGSKVLGK